MKRLEMADGESLVPPSFVSIVTIAFASWCSPLLVASLDDAICLYCNVIVTAIISLVVCTIVCLPESPRKQSNGETDHTPAHR